MVTLASVVAPAIDTALAKVAAPAVSSPEPTPSPPVPAVG
jgi:hypothetical protein